MATTLWRAGERITAARLNSITATWQSWTPTWTADAGTVPSFGNSVVTGSYSRTGDLITWRLEVTFGSTTAFGSAAGNWRFSLPVPASSSMPIVGMGDLQRTSAGNSAFSRMIVRARADLASSFVLEMTTARVDAAAVSGFGIVDNASPWTWATDDTFRMYGTYDAA